MSKRQSALRLAAQGFRVFPLQPNGKTPAHAGVNWQRIASSDPQRVHEMWTDPVFDSELDYNIGIAPDANLMVFDEDTRDGKTGDKSRELLEAIYEPMPTTFTVRTASGGVHRYYRTATRVSNSGSKVATHIDIKTEGGFVVAAGSTIDGVPYEVIDASPIATAPSWLTTLAGAPRERSKTATGQPLIDLDSEAAIARAIDWLASAAPENGTYAVAARVKDIGISESKCTELLLEHWPPGESKGEDHVAFRVANAYRYGQNAPGIAAPESEFGPVEIDGKPNPRKRLHFVPWSDAKPNFDQPYLIDGILDLGTMAVTYGDSNTGKTFVKLDQAFHIAAGRDWNGHKVKHGVVVYVAAEGGTGFAKRVEAFKIKYGLRDIPFAVVPCGVDLFSPQGDTGALVRLIREIETHYSGPTVLIVIDTLARAMAGGDENTSMDMGKFVANCDRLRQATGATVNIIHHTGKDKAKGARGSSALRAATDTEIEIGQGTLTVTKQRDMPRGDEMRFELESVDIGHRADGKVVTSAVVRWLEANEFDERVSPVALEMLGVLEQMIAAEKDRLEDAGEDASDPGIVWTDWQDALLAGMRGARGKKLTRTTLFGLRRELLEAEKVAKDSHNMWRLKSQQKRH